MCGIIGIAGDLTNKAKKAFEDMLIFSQVRGPYSTGVCGINYQNDAVLAKVVGRPDQLIDYDKRYERAVDFNKKLMLGHNRMPTIGKITAKNAQPFAFDDIVGCHNGSVNEFALRRLKIDSSLYQTDSEAILANIDKHGIQETLRPLNGAWALVWFDSRNNTLNFTRNRERPLNYCYSHDRQIIFFASEAGFLKNALGRNEITRSKVYEVDVDTHFRWTIPGRNQSFSKPTVSKVVSDVQVHPGWTPPWREHTQTGRKFPDGDTDPVTRAANDEPTGETHSNFIGSSDVAAHHQAGMPPNKVYDQAMASAANTQKEPFEVPHSFSSFRDLEKHDIQGQGYVLRGKGVPLYRGFRGDSLNKEQFEEATKDGCEWCGAQAFWGGAVRFFEPKRHICLRCNSNDEIKYAASVGNS